MTTSANSIENAATLVNQINEIITKTSGGIGLSFDAENVLFDVLMTALGKAERARTTAMIEERKTRNAATHSAIDTESK